MRVGEEKALNVGPSGIEMAYERFGDRGAPDTAADTVGLLDVLGLDSAHIVGASRLGRLADRRHPCSRACRAASFLPPAAVE